MKKVLWICMVSAIAVSVGVAQEPQTPGPARTTPENSAPDQNNAETEDPEGENEDTSKITDLPLLEDLEIPSSEELLSGEQISWIIVVNDRVVFSRPISPRPNTLEVQAEQYETLRVQKTPRDPEAADQFRKKLGRLQRVRGGFPGGSQFPEFLIEVKDVQAIWHHEDLMLKRADLLMQENKLNEAYELLFTLQTINSSWPGLEDRHLRLTFLDAEQLWNEGQREAALARYEELYRIEPKYPELLNRMSERVNQLIEAAVDAGDFRRARHYFHRLESVRDNLQVVREWREKFSSMMQTSLQQARAASDEQNYAQAVSQVERATEIWPYSVELRDEHRRISRRYQVLKVGALRPAGSKSSYPFPTPSDERYDFLKTRPLFEITQFDGSPRYRTTLIEQWEPTELGRNIVLQFRTDFDYWNSQKPVTSIAVAQSLSRQLNPESEEYDERLSGYLRAIQVHSPYRMELEFARAPLRPEAILNRAVLGPTDSSEFNDWFRETDRTERSCTWIRSLPEPEDAPGFHVAEVQETGYDNHEEALRALFRGEVDYLPTLPLKHVSPLQEAIPWLVRKYVIPETHLLQFHPESVLSRSSELRRALLYALDREEILAEEVLREAPREFGRLTTSPVPTTSESYSPLVKPFEPNLRVGLSLALAAAKTQGGKLPTLKMIVPPEPGLQPVIDRMIKRWQRIGVEVIVVDPGSSETQQWDIVYRRVSLTEPLTQLWPLLTMEPTPRVADLQDLPGWLRQELIRLDLTTNWEDANTILFRLHEHLWQEVFYLPLWELDRYSIARRNISGIPVNPLQSYQDLSSWTVDPWFDQSQP